MSLWRDETFDIKGRQMTKKFVVPYVAWYVGYDPGKVIDYPAVAIMCHSRVAGSGGWRVNEAAGWMKQPLDERYEVVALRRLPLGTLYPDQIIEVMHTLASVAHRCDLVIDDTNTAVGDMCVEAGLKPVRIVFTGGDAANRVGHRRYNVPRSIIVNCIEAKLHTDELRFSPKLLDGEALKDELANFHRSVAASGRLGGEAARGHHDDLIDAIGVALWWAVEKPKREFMEVRGIPGMH